MKLIGMLLVMLAGCSDMSVKPVTIRAHVIACVYCGHETRGCGQGLIFVTDGTGSRGIKTPEGLRCDIWKSHAYWNLVIEPKKADFNYDELLSFSEAQ